MLTSDLSEPAASEEHAGFSSHGSHGAQLAWIWNQGLTLTEASSSTHVTEDTTAPSGPRGAASRERVLHWRPPGAPPPRPRFQEKPGSH